MQNCANQRNPYESNSLQYHPLSIKDLRNTPLTRSKACGFRYNPAMPTNPSCPQTAPRRPPRRSPASPSSTAWRANCSNRRYPDVGGWRISNLVRAASGHVHFTLKDASAQVRCAMWRNRAQLLAFRPENGMRVEARALVTLYGRAATTSSASRRCARPASAACSGLQPAQDQTRRRRPLRQGRPSRAAAYPRALGIVTSPQAAALRDVLVTLRARAASAGRALPRAGAGRRRPARACRGGPLRRAARRRRWRRCAAAGAWRRQHRGPVGLQRRGLARAPRLPFPPVVRRGPRDRLHHRRLRRRPARPTPSGAAELASAGWHAARRNSRVLEPRLRHRAVERRFGELASAWTAPRCAWCIRANACAASATRSHAWANACAPRHRAGSGCRPARHPRRAPPACRRAAPQALAARRHARRRASRGATRLLDTRSQRLDALAAHLQHLAPQACWRAAMPSPVTNRPRPAQRRPRPRGRR